MNDLPQALNVRWIPFRNDASEAAPGHAILRVTGWDTSGEVLKAAKPNAAWSSSGLFAFNGAAQVSAGGQGWCTFDLPATALYDSGTPALGQTWGPQNNSWKLHTGNSGYTILDQVSSSLKLAKVMAAATASPFTWALVHLGNNIQAIPYGVHTPVSFTVKEHDDGGYFSSSSPTKLTISSPGVYHVGYSVYWRELTALFQLDSQIRKNGSDPLWLPGSMIRVLDSSGSRNDYTAFSSGISTLAELEKDDYLEVTVVRQSTDVSPPTMVATLATAFWIAKLR